MKVMLFALGMLVQLVVGVVGYRLGCIRARRSEAMLTEAEVVMADAEAALTTYQQRWMVN